MASTEKTYKYHMQIQEDEAPPPPSSPPPATNAYKEVLKPVNTEQTKSAGAVKANLTQQFNSPSSHSQVQLTWLHSNIEFLYIESINFIGKLEWTIQFQNYYCKMNYFFWFGVFLEGGGGLMIQYYN